MPGDAVPVLYCNEPYAVFVFNDPTLAESVSDDLSMLIENHAADRRTSLEALENLLYIPPPAVI